MMTALHIISSKYTDNTILQNRSERHYHNMTEELDTHRREIDSKLI